MGVDVSEMQITELCVFMLASLSLPLSNLVYSCLVMNLDLRCFFSQEVTQMVVI